MTPSPKKKTGLDKIAASILAPPEQPDEIGRLGVYRVLSVLGKGGMGMVFRAEDPALRRLVALKIMLPELAKRGSAKERFLREAQAAAALEHDHVVTIHQVGEDRGIPFIAMSFLKGMSLDDWLKQKRPLAMPQILRIGRETAKGLAAAHERGLIHRDIKPANLWLDGSARGRVKILDFGLARAEKEDVALTRSGQIIGTPQYMSPEQAAGEKLDARSDLFSLGVVLYRMCTGTQPFRGDNVMAVLTALAVHEPPSAISLNAETPPAFSDLIDRLLRKKPAERVGTAKEVVEAIAKIERDRALLKLGAAPTEFSVTPESAPADAARMAASQAFNFEDSTDSFLSDDELAVPRKAKEPVAASRNAAWLWPAIFGGIAALVLGVVAIPIAILSSRSNGVEMAKGNDRPGPVVPKKDPPSIEPPPINPGPVVPNPPDTKGAAPRAPKGRTVNLLPLVDPERDKIAGNWRVTDDGLECEASQLARIRVPYRPVGQYDFRIVFTRRTGGLAVTQLLSQAGKGLLWSMSAGGKWCGIEMLEGKDVPSSPKHADCPLRNGQRYESIVHVRNNAVRGYLDGNPLFEVWTNFGTVSMPPSWSLGDETVLGLGSSNGVVCFHEIEVIEHSGPGSFVRSERPRSNPSAGDDDRSVFRFDALPLIEIAQDEAMGPWSFDKLGELSAGDAEFARIAIPYIPPAEFDIRTSFTRQSGNDGVAQILVGGGRQFHFGFGAYRNTLAVFDKVDKMGGWENKTRVKHHLVNGKRYESRLEVRKDRVTAYLDGERITSLDTDYSNVELNGSYKLKDARTLGLAMCKSPTVFHRVEITEISGPGKFLRPDRPAAKAIETARAEFARKKPVESMPPTAVAPFDIVKAGEFQRLWADHLHRKVEETNSIGMRLRLIPPGEFTMGDRRFGDSKPHPVRLTQPYCLGACEVTRGEYAKVVLSADASNPMLPRGSVTWNDAKEFCRQLSERPEERAAGRRYRLPTEAEWEYACRAGTTTKFHFGDEIDVTKANFKGAGPATLRPVASYPPNAWGLYDMHGNVREWVNDWYDADYLKTGPRDDPKGPEKGTSRIVRGGGMSDPSYLAGQRVMSQTPETKHGDMGFRVVCEISARGASAWEPLFNGKDLDNWMVCADKEAGLVTIETIDGEPAIRIAGKKNHSYLSSVRTFRDFDLSLQFRFDETEKRSGTMLGLVALSGDVGLTLWISGNTSVQRNHWRLRLEKADLKDGMFLPKGLAESGAAYPAEFLNPTGQWNWFEMIRLDDAAAFRLNDHFLGAVAGILAATKNKEGDIGRSNINLDRTEGTVYYRRVEIREIHEPPPGFASP